MCEVAWDIIIDAPRCEITPQFYIYSLRLLFHDEVARECSIAANRMTRCIKRNISIACFAIIGLTIVSRVQSQLSRFKRNSAPSARSEEFIGLGFDELSPV